MTDTTHALLAPFEANRARLRTLALRILGSAAEAEDAVQEVWLRVSRSDASPVDSMNAWLTTIVVRVSLNMLRSRRRRAEEPMDARLLEPIASGDAERDMMLADAVGLALLVILGTLDPAEQLAFVLHDMFAVPFDEIGAIVGRSPAAARQLASRARRRVRAAATDRRPSDAIDRHQAVEAFLTAARGGDFEAVVSVLLTSCPERHSAPCVQARRQWLTARARGAGRARVPASAR